MTNPTPHGQVPEALRIADEFKLCSEFDSIPSIIDIEKAEAELRRQHARIAELEVELEAVGAGGVQALSAAPNGWESVIDEARSGLQDSEPSAFDNSGYRAFAETVLDSVEEGLNALAASPSPPAEQQAAPKAAPGEPYQDSTPHLSVGDSSFESWFSSYCPANKGDKQRARDAYAAGMGDPLVVAAPQQEVQEPAAFIHWPINGPPRLVWYSQKALNDAILKTHEDGYKPDVKLYTAPQPAPAPLSEQDPLQGAANWLAQAHGMFCTAVLQSCLMIGYNRAKRLHDAALAAQGGKV